MKAVAVVSGGLDSTVLLYLLRSEGWALRGLSFDYGQRHVRELDVARAIAADLGVTHDVVDLRSVGALLTGSALTDRSVEVPAGHYTDDSMKATIVSNRNAIFASVAIGVAVSEGADAIALGVHAGDHTVYPDCRPEFIAATEHQARIANDRPDLRVLAPFVDKSKADIVRCGAELGVPMARTWSCYEGGDLHCGTCGTCVERREAFDLAGVSDPTSYA